MRDQILKLLRAVRDIWRKFTFTQQLLFIAVVIVVFGAIIMLVAIGSAPSATPLLTQPINNLDLLDRISIRLDQENVSYQVTGDQRILVESQNIARRMRTILTSEGLIPNDTDPWDLFDIERWTQTDFERNVNLQRAVTRQLKQHIEALDDIDSAEVTLAIPEETLFTEQQNPVTASIILNAKPGSDVAENRQKIEGIQQLIRFAVEGLTAENITITDRNGIVLNDFSDAAGLNQVARLRQENKVAQELERSYIQAIVSALSGVYGPRRVRVINVDVTLDTSTSTLENTEFYPVTLVEDNPDTPFNERQFTQSITRSQLLRNEDYAGTGFNPEGPPGQEGQTPPAYQDLEGLVGRWSRDENIINNEINSRRTVAEKAPEIKRITASVALDGTWQKEYDDQGDLIVNLDGSIQRTYTPVSLQQIADAERLIRDAIGYDNARKDSVTVAHVQFDRSDEQSTEDQSYQRQQEIRQAIFIGLIAIAFCLVAFIIIRLILRKMERTRREKQWELERQHDAARAALIQGEGAESDRTSDGEKKRRELQESVANMARERPEESANLLRTWLQE